MPDTELELVLRRGLAEAVRRTNAWLVTSGQDCGVSAQAGAAMQQVLRVPGHPQMACLGIVPWDRLHLSRKLERVDNGKPYRVGIM
jgi:hypothetical protein